MRVFMAMELPAQFADDVAALSRQLELVCEGRFVRRENRHLTLAFLGDLGQAEVVAATDALEAACSGAGPVSLASAGLGTFGRRDDATLWLGVAKNPQLMDLAQRLRDELDKRDLDYDQKAFMPHVTLARRARTPGGELGALPFPEPDNACTVTLFRSILDADGVIYKPLHTVTLEGPGRDR